MISVVTTLHKDGFDLYGKDNFKSWVKYFPSDWSIVYYAEDHCPKLDKRIKILDFHEACPSWTDFYEDIKNKTLESDLKSKEINRLKKAIRWSFKSFVLIHALENSAEKYVMWIDSDVCCIDHPPKEIIKKYLNGAAIACQLERIKGKNHIETGAVLIDTSHPDILKIKDWIKKGYYDKEILQEDKPWDGMWLAKLLSSNAVAWKDVRIVSQKPSPQYWLNHRVGKDKFKNPLINNRSGRLEINELL